MDVLLGRAWQPRQNSCSLPTANLRGCTRGTTRLLNLQSYGASAQIPCGVCSRMSRVSWCSRIRCGRPRGAFALWGYPSLLRSGFTRALAITVLGVESHADDSHALPSSQEELPELRQASQDAPGQMQVHVLGGRRSRWAGSAVVARHAGLEKKPIKNSMSGKRKRWSSSTARPSLWPTRGQA